MIGIKAKVTLERTLYLDLPKESSKEDILKAAKLEIKSPADALYTAAQALKSLHISIPKLDLKDWSESEVTYDIINDN